MAPSTEEIRVRLTDFAGRWGVRAGYEKGEAQSFLREFFLCFGAEVSDRAEFEVKPLKGGGFIDCLIPGLLIVEMKSASEAGKLEKHRPQVMDYWQRSADPAAGTAAPPYVILWAFTRLELWEPGRFPVEPVLALDLEELPAHFAAFTFLLDREPVYDSNHEQVTVAAANELARLLSLLENRNEGTPRLRRSFLLQCVWCMFAEDTGQIDALGFTRILDGLIRDSHRASEDDLGGLFEVLRDPSPERPAHGLYEGVPYVNGSLFADPARLHLNREELGLLRKLAGFDWSKIKPAVFGSIMQSVFGPERQHQLGAHYTPEAEIQHVVGPTIVRPWQARIDGVDTFEEGLLLLEDLHAWRVLDPACGCGNFLSIAYREIRGLEKQLLDRISVLSLQEGRGEWKIEGREYFPVTNMSGIEVEPFAVDLARLSLWMAQWLVGQELGLTERTLPLVSLEQIRRDDALRVAWPEADAIVGNPPYHGSQNLRSVLPEAQIEYLEQEFGCGLKDLCVYWFRRAADVMKPGDRAGLVGTNSISQNRARGASLNYVVERGGLITDAVSRHKWPGEAVVNVSIVNWVMSPESAPQQLRLDGHEVQGINTRLQESLVPIEEYEQLPANAGRAFQGPIPGGDFYLDEQAATTLLERDGQRAARVVRPFLVGRDIAEDPGAMPTRWIIDFASLSLEEATGYPACLERVREKVKPEREKNNRAQYRKYWWRFVEPRRGMRQAIAGLDRFIAGTATGKRFLFAWVDKAVCPSNATNVFAFEDDYSMGILASSIHGVWALSEGSTLEDRPRYTPTSCFETFPWPQPSVKQREQIAGLSRTLIKLRGSICSAENIGLTTLYNRVEEGAWQDLAAAHRELDRAVARAYGWPAATVGDELDVKARLAALHATALTDPAVYQPFDS